MKDRFIWAFQEIIRRDGAGDLLKWLKNSDFFEAPASTRYHLPREGGLVEHSVHVYSRLKSLMENERTNGGNSALHDVSDETVAICGLLHDVCKADFYKVELRNAKDETGQWVKVPYYTVDDQLPYGHGEKSVYIISGFMKLTRDEAMAIRWHMGGFDEAVRGGGNAVSGAWAKHPLGVLLHAADLQATFIDETRGGGA